MIFGLILIIFLTACHVEKPEIIRKEITALTRFTHQGLESENCEQCHTKDLPTKKHGQNMDCATCHNTLNWGSLNYSHSPTPKNCADCHLVNSPDVSKYPLPDYEVVEGHYPSRDCLDCHIHPPQIDSWIYKHSNNKDEDIKFCLPCHTTRGMNRHPIPSWFEGVGICFRCHSKRMSWDFIRPPKKKN